MARRRPAPSRPNPNNQVKPKPKPAPKPVPKPVPKATPQSKKGINPTAPSTRKSPAPSRTADAMERGVKKSTPTKPGALSRGASAGTPTKSSPRQTADAMERRSSKATNNRGALSRGVPTKKPGTSAPRASADTWERRNTPTTYKVQKGDNLTKLAKRYGTTVDAIVKQNKGKIKDPNLIYTGDTLTIKPSTHRGSQKRMPAGKKPSSSQLRDLKSTGVPKSYSKKSTTGKSAV